MKCLLRKLGATIKPFAMLENELSFGGRWPLSQIIIIIENLGENKRYNYCTLQSSKSLNFPRQKKRKKSLLI